MQRANYEGMETLSGLCVAACGGGVSRPVLTHICLTLVTIAVRVATFCPQEQVSFTDYNSDIYIFT